MIIYGVGKRELIDHVVKEACFDYGWSHPFRVVAGFVDRKSYREKMIVLMRDEPRNTSAVTQLFGYHHVEVTPENIVGVVRRLARRVDRLIIKPEIIENEVEVIPKIL